MKFIDKYYKYFLLFIPVLSLVMHLHVFKLDLVGIHVWRQTQTQTVIDNFYKEDFNIFHSRINDKADTDRILRMEFPVMQWVFALFYKIFGNHIYISRILTFIIGLFSVYGMFYLCKNIFKNRAIGVIAAWAFNFSPVFYYYTVNPLPDNFALCCAIWSVGLFFSYTRFPRSYRLVLSAIMLCLAILAKLPFILYGSVMVTYILLQVKNKEWDVKKGLQVSLVYFFIVLPAIAWYMMVVPTWDKAGIVAGITNSKDSIYVTLDILQFTLVSSLPELLINYGSLLFFISAFYFMIKRKAYKNKLFPVFLLWGVSIILYFLYEMNMIGKVHDYYLFPFLPPIFILVSYGAYRLLSTESVALKYFCLMALAVLPLTAYLRADTRWNTTSPGFNAVYYNYKQELRALIPQNAYVVVGSDDSHFILLYYLDRKGWAFDHDQLSPDQLNYFISKGAAYLSVDDQVDNNPEIKKHLAEKIFEKESVRVYKLK